MFVEQCWFSQKVVGNLSNDYFIVWCWGLCLHCIILWGLKATKKRVYPVCHIRTRAAECCSFFFTRRLDRWVSPDPGCEDCVRGQGHQHFWHARVFPSQITAHLISLSGRCSAFIWPWANWKLTAGAGRSVPWEEPRQTSPGDQASAVHIGNCTFRQGSYSWPWTSAQVRGRLIFFTLCGVSTSLFQIESW